MKYLLMNVLAYLLFMGIAYAAINNNWIAPRAIIAIEFIFNSVSTFNLNNKNAPFSTNQYISLS